MATRKGFRLWVLVVLSFGASSVLAESAAYFSAAGNVSIHNMDKTEEDKQISSGDGLSLALGVEMLPILSFEVEASAWYPRENEEYDFTFVGMSIGSNAVLHFPKVGPYAKFGRHCWGVSVTETPDSWDGSGCSNSMAGGILFDGYFFEVSRKRYKKVDSWFFSAGVRFQ